RTMTNTRATIVADRAGSIGNLFSHDRAQRLGGHVRNVVRTNLAASLNEREYGFLTRAADVALLALAKMLVLLLAAYIGLVKLNGLARAAKRASRAQLAHTFANAMRHEPRGLVG